MAAGRWRERVRLAVAISALGLAACSPRDLSAVRSSPTGVPQVENCGGHIHALDVADADSGRRIWSVGAPAARGVGSLEVGRLPAGWRLEEALVLDPRPEVWRLDVDTSGGRSVIDVADADLQRESVLLEGGATETFESFKESTCPPIPESTRLLLRNVMLGGIAAAAVTGVLALALSRRRKSSAAAEC